MLYEDPLVIGSRGPPLNIQALVVRGKVSQT